MSSEHRRQPKIEPALRESRQSGIIESLGRENVQGYFLILAGVFVAIGSIDLALNVVFPALHSIDGAAASGIIATGFGVASAKI